jgi:hypothetical protein
MKSAKCVEEARRVIYTQKEDFIMVTLYRKEERVEAEERS